MSQREQRDRGDQEDGDLRARGERDLRGELDLAAVRRRRPRRRARLRCRRSRRSPRRRRTRTGRPPRANDLERADEDLRDERRHDRRDGEHERARSRSDQPSISSSLATCIDACRRSEYHGDARRRRPGATIETGIESLTSESRSGSPSQPGSTGSGRAASSTRDEPEREEARLAVDLAAAAGEEREAEHEQQVPDHGSGQRAAHDLVQPLVDGDQRDDQLGRVAERGVEEAADPRAGVLGRVLGRLADQPRERDQRGAARTNSTVSSRCSSVVQQRRRAARSATELKRTRAGPWTGDPTDGVDSRWTVRTRCRARA